MNKLPQELIDHISSFLEPEVLKNTLTVSPAFQVAAEKYSGAYDEFELTEETTSRFVDIFGGRRLGYLQHLSFRTTLSPLDKTIDPGKWGEEMEARGIRETKEELQEADQCFTEQIQLLFSTIKNVEDRAGTQFGPGRIKLTVYTPTRYIAGDYYPIQRAYVSWRVHLLHPELLPDLVSVRELRIENGMRWYYDMQWNAQTLRKIDLRALIDLASKLPNLAALHCYIGGDEWLANNKSRHQQYITKDWAGPRRDSRHDFARTLATISLPGLRVARLSFIAPLMPTLYFDQLKAFPNLVAPHTHDTFSSSLRVLSQRLRRFSLTALVDHTLFWPTDGVTPFWYSLEVLNVTFHIMTPSGEWYFNCLKKNGSKHGYLIKETDYPPYVEKKPNYYFSSDEIDWNDIIDGRENRIVPNEDTLVPLLESFAKAATCMPRLKQALLWAPLELSKDRGIKLTQLTNHVRNGIVESLAWGFYYASPDAETIRDHRDQGLKGARQIWWHVAKWRPDKALHELFEKIGKNEHGDILIEHWEDDFNGTGFCHRDEFEQVEKQLFKNDFLNPRPRG